MGDYYSSNDPEVERTIVKMYREFFDKAEKKRRWSLSNDIPWHQCNKDIDSAIADVVESFCAVELFLPDYVGKYLPHNRAFRGRAWFTMNWGYEESKHSLALGDWLLHSKRRSDEQMEDLDKQVVAHEWHLPMDNDRGMVAYSMMQERATWLHYRNLAQVIGEKGDPALHRLLRLIAVDECAHYDFFINCVKLHLQVDRAHMVEQLRRVISTFAMPAVHMLTDGRQRMEAVRSLHIFDEEIFYKDVVTPILEDLGVTRHEMRRRTRREWSVVGGPAAPQSQDLSQLRKSA